MTLIDHNILIDCRFSYQRTPHADSEVYSLKQGICRGDMFIQRRGREYDIRLASYYNGEPDNEFIRTITTQEELELFYQHALNTILPCKSQK